MGFEFEDDVLERERRRLTLHIEAKAEELGAEPGNTYEDMRSLNLCDRVWDGRAGDRWINIDLSKYDRIDAFLKTIGLDDEIDLLTLTFPPNKVSLDLAWDLHRKWLYERIGLDEMESILGSIRMSLS